MPGAPRAKVETYFGAIPAGSRRSPVTKTGSPNERNHPPENRRTGCPQAAFTRSGTSPPWGTGEGEALTWRPTSSVRGKNSRLYKRLVYDDQIATQCANSRIARNRRTIRHRPTARPGDRTLAQVEKAIDEELARFLTDGTGRKGKRVKTQPESVSSAEWNESVGSEANRTSWRPIRSFPGDSPDYLTSPPANGRHEGTEAR